jgi:hypothetical protein
MYFKSETPPNIRMEVTGRNLQARQKIINNTSKSANQTENFQKKKYSIPQK